MMTEEPRKTEEKSPEPVVAKPHQHFSAYDGVSYLVTLFCVFMLAAMLEADGSILTTFLIAVLAHMFLCAQIFIRFRGKLSRLDYNYIRFGVFYTWLFSATFCLYLWTEGWAVFWSRYLPQLHV